MKILKVFTIILIIPGIVFSYLSLGLLVYHLLGIYLPVPSDDSAWMLWIVKGVILVFPVIILLLYLLPLSFNKVKIIRRAFLFFWINALFWTVYVVMTK
ncbi:hypothetical protein [Pedobacter chitinilyticus]|uniref:Uncharacterized protein n=1 Tax=Pedobacter chitinilyticus TaxID=2233776 RepID=A0A3S3PC16_9SPHI|nr:hypothetical protein [Pedobacter chitinilyticus]RWU08106.1 hypothetical protein DPV69_06910 [Pedobacter chitinilyticus]